MSLDRAKREIRRVSGRWNLAWPVRRACGGGAASMRANEAASRTTGIQRKGGFAGLKGLPTGRSGGQTSRGRSGVRSCAAVLCTKRCSRPYLPTHGRSAVRFAVRCPQRVRELGARSDGSCVTKSSQSPGLCHLLALSSSVPRGIVSIECACAPGARAPIATQRSMLRQSGKVVFPPIRRPR